MSHQRDKCGKCGGYLNRSYAQTYRSKACNCDHLEYIRHQELIESIKSLNYMKTPNSSEPSFTEIAKQMRLNCDILKKEFSDHVDKEIERFKKETKL